MYNSDNEVTRLNLKSIIEGHDLSELQASALFHKGKNALWKYMTKSKSVREIPDTMKVVIGIYTNIIANNGWDGFITYCKNNKIIPENFEEL